MIRTTLVLIAATTASAFHAPALARTHSKISVQMNSVTAPQIAAAMIALSGAQSASAARSGGRMGGRVSRGGGGGYRGGGGGGYARGGGANVYAAPMFSPFGFSPFGFFSPFVRKREIRTRASLYPCHLFPRPSLMMLTAGASSNLI